MRCPERPIVISRSLKNPHEANACGGGLRSQGSTPKLSQRSALGMIDATEPPDAGEFVNWKGPAAGAGAEGLAEGPLLGDERTLTECNATSQFDPSATLATSEKARTKPVSAPIKVLLSSGTLGADTRKAMLEGHSDTMRPHCS
jgi:hypothetical protein